MSVGVTDRQGEGVLGSVGVTDRQGEGSLGWWVSQTIRVRGPWVGGCQRPSG